MYVALKPFKGGAQKMQSDQFSSKILTVVCDYFKMVQDRMSFSTNH